MNLVKSIKNAEKRYMQKLGCFAISHTYIRASFLDINKFGKYKNDMGRIYDYD